MAVTITAKRLAVSLKLNNGVSDKGTTKTLSVSLGSMSKTAFDADKVMNIVAVLSPCFSKELLRVEKTAVDILEAA
ncbi:MAG: hypothetical protein IJT21_10995 [Synergistaceae bacterium]|nr:hypothetical protein [Synergistaceae bacterium]